MRKNTIGAKRSWVASAMVVISAVLGAQADTWYWTGAAGGTATDDANVKTFVWNNAANWSKTSSTGASDDTVPSVGATVVFSSFTGSALTNVIDLTSMVTVGVVRVEGAAATSYQFGTGIGTSKDAGGQNFFVNSDSEIIIDENVINDQRIMRLGFDSISSANNNLKLTNNSSAANFIVDTIATIVNTGGYIDHYGVGKFITHYAQHFSTGAPYVRFYGSCQVAWRNQLYCDGKSNGGACMRPMTVGGSVPASGARQFEVTAGGKIYCSCGTSPFTGFFTAEVNTRVFGEGYVAANTHVNSGNSTGLSAGNEGIRGMGLFVSSGKTLTVDIPLMPWNSDVAAKANWWDGYIPLSGNAEGIIRLNSTNGCTRACRIYGQPRIEVAKLGNSNTAADETSLGPGEIVFSPYFDNKDNGKTASPRYTARMSNWPNATLAYVGSGATASDRNILITNACYELYASSAMIPYYNTGIATGTVANAGSGILTLSGQVRALNPNAAFVLKPETQPIVFTGSFAESPAVALAIAGTEETRMATIPENIASLSLMNGANLVLSDSTSTEAPVRVIGTGNTLTIASGKTVTIPWSDDLVAGGALNVVLPADATLKLSGATTATSVPAALTVNGQPSVILNADGQLVENVSYWKTAQDGDWSTAGNWTNDLLPGGSRPARIEVGGADYTVSVGATPTAVDQVFVGQGETGHTSTLKLAAPMPYKMTYDIAAGGELCVTNGCELTNSTKVATIDLSRGGKLMVSGDGQSNLGCLVFDGTAGLNGDTSFTGDGQFIATKRSVTLNLYPASDDATATLTIDRREAVGGTNSQHQLNSGTLRIGTYDNCGKSVLNVYGKDATSQNYNRIFNSSLGPYALIIGYGRGNAELNLYSGYLRLGNNACSVPAYDNGYSSPAIAVTGVVNQTGGRFELSAYSAPSSGYQIGFRIGCAEYYYKGMSSDNVAVKGTHNLSEGAIVISPGYTIIGSGNGEGALLQSGGTFTHKSYCTSSVYTNHLNRAAVDGKVARTFYYPLIIGYVGGKGLYEISGGTAAVDFFPMYIGTNFREEFPWGISAKGADLRPETDFFDYSRTGAEGTLRVKGGSFNCATNIFLGSTGNTGTIEMVSTNGSLYVEHLVATSGVNSVLSFVCDTNDTTAGVAPLKAKTVVLEGAKLNIALGKKYAGHNRIKLVEATESITGDFGSVNITGRIGGQAWIEKDDETNPKILTLRIKCGTVILMW